MPPTAPAEPSLGRAMAMLAAADEVTVLTGAGISTDSGIADFRGPNGVWTRDPAAERRAGIAAYVNEPAVRRDAWQRRLRHPVDARPNAAHRALVDLERQGQLRAVLTQNIDGLHQKAGNDPALVLELHGTMHSVLCLRCADRSPMSEALARVRAGEDDPPCLRCGGVLKAATVSFGQRLPERVYRAAVCAASDCDVLLVIGSSLTVEPAAGLVQLAADAGAGVVIVNAQPTRYDRFAEAVVRAPIGEAIPSMVAAVVSQAV